MNCKHEQRGITFLGLVFVLIVLAMVGLVGLKLLPVYMESFKTDYALKGVIEDPGVTKMTPKEIAFAFVRRLDIDGEYRIAEGNYKEFMTISKKKGKVTITVDWKAEVPLVANLSIVAAFRKEVQN